MRIEACLSSPCRPTIMAAPCSIRFMIRKEFIAMSNFSQPFSFIKNKTYSKAHRADVAAA